VPVAVVEATVKVSVDDPEPGAAKDTGLKPAVTPAGRPEAERVTAESKPSTTAVLTVVAAVLPWTAETEAGDAEIVKLGVCVEEPASALIRPLLGLPHPVTRS
jgi:hypothetical protein